MGLVLPLLLRENPRCLCFRAVSSMLGAYGSVIWHFIPQWASGCQNIPSSQGARSPVFRKMLVLAQSTLELDHPVSEHSESLQSFHTWPFAPQKHQQVQQCPRKSKTRRSPGQYPVPDKDSSERETGSSFSRNIDQCAAWQWDFGKWPGQY